MAEKKCKMTSTDRDSNSSTSSLADNENRIGNGNLYNLGRIDRKEISSHPNGRSDQKPQRNHSIRRYPNNKTDGLSGKEYATIAMKPAVFSELRRIADRYYPGMFLPSALIIMMNEVKRGDYFVDAYRISVNLEGRYTSLTIRSDVKVWLKENYDRLNNEYKQKYGAKNFSRFVTAFLLNLMQSKMKTEENIVRLKQADFNWLVDEYRRRRNNKYDTIHSVFGFEQFADIFFREMFDRVKSAGEILNV